MSSGDNETIEISDADLLIADPIVSVLMITFNHGEYIAEAIESVISQNADFPIELLIGEDCSTDNTRDVALAYQRKYPQTIRVVYAAANVGFHDNFRRLYTRARGEFLAICEGDDYWTDPKKLQLQVDALRLNPDCVVTYHDVVYLSSLDEPEPRYLLAPEKRKGYSRGQLLRYAYMPTVSMCFRKVLDEMPREFGQVLNLDTFMISMLGMHGGAVFVDNIKPAVYREHRGGVWSPLSMEEKKISNITTFFWMSVFYKNANRKTISNHYALTAMSLLLEIIDLDRNMFMKWFLTKYFVRAYSLFKAIRKKLSGNR